MKFIDLFAGIGGFRIALENNGNECVFTSEIDSFCQKVYNDNFGTIPAGDITKIDAKDIPDFDILAAGFPCQPFSYAGKLEGFSDKTRGTLFFDVVRIIKEKKPKMFLLENVKGIVSHDHGRTLKTIVETLSDIGYRFYWTVIDSHDFGVPQHRHRWYCVGFDKNIAFSFPEGTNPNTTLRDIVVPDEDDPSLKLTKFECDRIDYHFAHAKPGDRVQHDNSKYGPNTKKGKYGIYSFQKPDGSLRFHVGDYAKTQIQEAYYCSLDSVSPAIIAARSPKLLEYRRHLSILECKRLQGFPDNFIMDESDQQARKQLGNSVSIPVIDAIVKNMMKAYEDNIAVPRCVTLDDYQE